MKSFLVIGTENFLIHFFLKNVCENEYKKIGDRYHWMSVRYGTATKSNVSVTLGVLTLVFGIHHWIQIQLLTLHQN
jgi:hypothetical protein